VSQCDCHCVVHISRCTAWESRRVNKAPAPYAQLWCSGWECNRFAFGRWLLLFIWWRSRSSDASSFCPSDCTVQCSVCSMHGLQASPPSTEKRIDQSPETCLLPERAMDWAWMPQHPACRAIPHSTHSIPCHAGRAAVRRTYSS
jgi:hypothetical protein